MFSDSPLALSSHTSYVKLPTDRMFLVKVRSLFPFLSSKTPCTLTVYVIPDEDLKLSLATLETDANFTEHLAAHITATRHHLTGAPEPPEPSYAPSFHQPAGYRTVVEKALFSRRV